MILHTFRMQQLRVLLVGLSAICYLLLSASAVYAQQKPAQLFLYPDPVVLTPSGSAVVDIWLDANVPVYEVRVVLELSDDRFRFAEFFEGTKTHFRVQERAIDAQRVSFTLRADEGHMESGTIGRILLVAADTADPGTQTQITFGSATTLVGPDGESLEPVMRPADISTRRQPRIPVTSTTHLDESSWYSRRSANVTWGVSEGSAYSYDISTLPTNVPDAEPEDAVGAIEMHELTDGIWYFALCELSDGECGDISRRRYMIDGTSPRSFSIVLEETEDGLYAHFSPYDEQSGIARVETAIDPEAALSGDRSVYREVSSPYLVPKGASGDLLIRATDYAGNATIARAALPRSFAVTSTMFAILVALFGALGLARYIKTRSSSPKPHL